MSTIYDVAKLAGVSYATVSSVLSNGSMRVSDKTKQRILDAAKTLNYQANRAAQQLATGKYNTISLCFESASQQFFLDQIANQLIAGIGRSASENGLYLLLAPTAIDYRFEQTIGSLPSQGIDGGIVIGPVPLSQMAVAAIDNCSIPLVCIDSHKGFSSASTVDTDNTAGMKMGVDHLISNGHKKMAYIGPPPMYQCLIDRMTGFYHAVRDAGLRVDDQITHIVPLEDVPTAVRSSLETADMPTVLVCAEVRVAKLALDELMKLGLRIPGDLSILIYDDILSGHPLLESVNIVRSNFFQMGENAGDLLKKMIDGECSEPISLRIPAELVARTG